MICLPLMMLSSQLMMLTHLLMMVKMMNNQNSQLKSHRTQMLMKKPFYMRVNLIGLLMMMMLELQSPGHTLLRKLSKSVLSLMKSQSQRLNHNLNQSHSQSHSPSQSQLQLQHLNQHHSHNPDN